ncbi:FtsK/SpoIIIE domain-containing protein [Streptomyces sp. CRN 30]|uniref:FtsK/SpoIIIE domain-containing protein n=1 Tax=Streptomyces sp. CRN 30 TaxID=3075613 RepID=UPI002A80BC00|nr:FtsK/SpoIIIE domain-containing protein [Streptomyces sp. CRN 30]
MKLTLTTVDLAERRTDHLLDLPEGATVAELGTALGSQRLYLGDRPVNPDLRVGAAGIRAGAVVGLGTPVPERTATLAWQPPAGDPALVEIRHVGGPGAGRSWQLGPGSHEIGTDRGCALRLHGGDAPDRGVWVTVSVDGTVAFRLPDGTDPARHGLRSLTPPPPVDPETGTPLTAEEPAGPVDGGPGGHTPEPAPPGPDGLPARAPLPPVGERPSPSDGSEEWPPYADLALGDHLLRLADPFEADAAVNVSADEFAIEYNRPPRIAPHLDTESIRMQGPPGERKNRPFPFVMMMTPLVMGLVMMSLFRTFYFVVFIFFTPMMAIGNWLAGRRSGRRQQEEALRLYRLRRAALEREVREATLDERELRNVTFPDPATVLLTATGPGSLLWQRRRRDPDHLTLRLGTTTRPSLKRIDDHARENNHRQVHWRIADVPYGLEMADLGVAGVAGPGGTPRAMACWAVAQAAVLHSPRDLRVVVLTSEEHAEAWNWVRWLPHLVTGRPGSPVAVGNDPESTAHRVNELVADIQARITARGTSALGHTLLREPDVLVVLDGARRLRDVPGMVQVLTQGPGVRVFSLCVDERERLLPEECTAVVLAEGNRLTVRTSGVPEVEDVRADLVDAAWCEEVARALAPVRDVTVDSDSGLPSDVRLLPLLGQEPPNAAALAAAWARRPASTAFVLGAGYEGPLRLDLVRDGPHGLIGGTTGSGKSELLQTLIASLAAANRPDELTFVLVDYKGGSAFRECADLPHTLGMITDLDGHLVERALASLDAELKRRERVLARVEAKDHAEYRAKRARDPKLAPLPRLVLVIDEFATLVRELPDFVPGLISLAQRGRSLGLHLVLATQRPGGSVSNEIRANTNLRIALRVTDRAESQDIINAPDAVSISASSPGRALIRRGSEAPTPFQTAWVGAERGEAPAARSAASRPVRGVELTWSRLGRTAELPAAEDELPEPLSGEEPVTDLTALVEAIGRAAESLDDFTPEPSPWLEPLEDRVRAEDLPPVPPAPPGALPLVPYALLDIPHLQQRRLGTIDFASFGHLYVIGSPRSGRTQLLRTVAGAAALAISSADLHLYGIDASGGGLGVLESLPHCGAVVSRHDTERLERLVTRLNGELTARQRLIAQNGSADLADLRAKLPKDRRPARLLLLIDGWDALSALLDDYDGGRIYSEVVRLLREGAAAGIHVIATSERVLLGGRLAAHNDRRLLLKQADPSDYNVAGLNRHKVPAHIPPGRGWLAPERIEAQIALLPAEEGVDQADALREIGRRTTARDASVAAGRRPFRIEELPSMIGFQEAMDQVPEARRRPLWALLGIGGDAGEPIGYDFAAGGGSFMVAGPPRTGRSTTLASMCVSLLLGGTSLVVITPRDSQLRQLAAHDLAEVISDTDPSAEAVTRALEAVAGRPVVVVVDDADLLLNCRADKVLRQVAQSGRDHGQGLLLAGLPESMSSLGWVGMARRSRRGVLLGPKSIGEGDLIGSRISAEQVRTPLVTGRGWTASEAGTTISVQIPLTVLGG